MIRECPLTAATGETLIVFESATGGRVRLSPREFLLVSLAAGGLTDKEIAIRIPISLPTVKTYWQRVRQKFGAANRAQCVARFRDVYEVAPFSDEDSDVLAHFEISDEDFSLDTSHVAEVSDVPHDQESHDLGDEVHLPFLPAFSPLISEAEAAAWLGTDRTGLRRYRREGRLSWNTATRVYARAQVQALALELEQEILRAKGAKRLH